MSPKRPQETPTLFAAAGLDHEAPHPLPDRLRPVDEVHRFNRAQQDSFLPVMEDGTVVMVGATTENPSFELNAALLSRARVLVFRSLDAAAIEKLFAHAEEAEGRKLPLDEE